VLTDVTALAGWAYLAIVALVAIDAVFPVLPSEVAVVGAGVLAASGQIDLPLLIAAGTAGAVAGDLLGYSLGRGAGRFGVARLLRHARSRQALVWATERMVGRAVPVLVAGRFVPGGRTATTMVAGFLRVAPRRLLVASAIGAPLWSLYASLTGYLAGRAAADRPWLGVALSVAVLVLVGVLAEMTRRLRARTPRPAGVIPARSAGQLSPAMGATVSAGAAGQLFRRLRARRDATPQSGGGTAPAGAAEASRTPAVVGRTTAPDPAPASSGGAGSRTAAA